MVDGTVRMGGGSGQGEVTGQRQAMLTTNAAHLQDENNANQTMLALTLAIGMCRGHHCLDKDGVFGVVIVGRSDHDRTVRSRGQREGGDCIVGRGRDDNDEGEEQ